MSGANTYTGATTINSGASLLIVDFGSIENSTVINNGTFDISGASATGANLITDSFSDTTKWSISSGSFGACAGYSTSTACFNNAGVLDSRTQVISPFRKVLVCKVHTQH